MYNSDLLDKKIKSSFNNTNNMLTSTFSRSMPDLSSIGAPKKDLAQKIQSANETLPDVVIQETEGHYSNGYPENVLGQYGGYQDPLGSMFGAGNHLNQYRHNSGYHPGYHPGRFQRRRGSLPEDIARKEAELIQSAMPIQKDYIDPVNNGMFRPFGDHRFAQHGLQYGPYGDRRSYRDHQFSDFLQQNDQMLNGLALQRRASKGFLASEEYKRLLADDPNPKGWSDYYKTSNLYQQPSYTRKYQPALSTRESLESFMLNERAANNLTSRSADQYEPVRKDGSEGALSEPTQPASSTYAPITNPTTPSTYGVNAMRDSSIQNRVFYSGYTNSPYQTQSTPLYIKSFFLQEQQKPEENKQETEPMHDVGSSEEAEVEVISHESEEQEDDNPEQEDNNPEQEESPQAAPEHKDGYSSIAQKREEIKTKNNKRVKRKVEPKKQASSSEKTKSEKPQSQGNSPQAKATKENDQLFECKCENEESVEDVDVKESDDSVRPAPYFGMHGYNAYEQHLQRLKNSYQPHASVQYQQPSVQPASATANNHGSDQNENQTGLYDDNPYIKEYFSKQQHPLPPLKNTPPGSASNSPRPDVQQSAAKQQVDPLAFKLVNTDANQTQTKRNKMLRQKEYAEILRQNQKEIPREKPQVRSWNMRHPDENLYERRALAPYYAHGFPKPPLSEYNPPMMRYSDDQDGMVDAIEVMRRRHDEEKRAIAQMRVQIQQQIAQERIKPV